MFTPEDQHAIINLVAPLIEQTLARSMRNLGTPSMTLRPGTAVGVDVAARTVTALVDDGGTVDALVIGAMPWIDQRVMVLFAPPGAVFCFGEVGTIEEWSPTVVQTNTLTYTDIKATFSREGRTIKGRYKGSQSAGTGASGALITATTPVPAEYSTNPLNIPVGYGYIYDANVAAHYPMVVVLRDTNHFGFLTASSAVGDVMAIEGGFTGSLVTPDILAFSFEYEAA